MYQETLFFLLPFYFQSTVPRSPNVAFLGLLGLLALVSCLDLVFDDLLRRRRWFGLLFFSIVSFAALDFLLPLVLGLRLELATQLAAAAGLLAAITLVERPRERRRWREVAVQALPTLVATALLLGFPVLVPAVPLQLEEIAFARDVLPETLELVEPLGEAARSGDDRLAVVATIFAPRRVHAGVELEWRRDGEALEVSREIEVAPHRGGFRIWDTYRPAEGRLPPGTYTVIVRTTPGQVVGIGRVRLSE
jgi:hypothetical protein